MTSQNKTSQKTMPVQTYRDGAISIRIWKKEHQNSDSGETNIFYSIDMKRSYKSGDVWKTTSSINGQDAHRAAHLYTLASYWISSQEYSVSDALETLAAESGQ